MYTNFCSKCNQQVTTETSRLFINHVRWCGSTEKGTNKFQLKCSCLECKAEITTQNLQSHLRSTHSPKSKPTCIVCENTCSPNSKRFCSRSCSATFNNKKRDYTVFKPGPIKGTNKGVKRAAPYTKIKQCVYCHHYHAKTAKTCSPECLSKHLSLVTGGNRDCNIPGTDSFGKHFYFDSGWEITLANSLNDNKISWARPERFVLSTGKTYSPDFYLPDYDVYIDPKAKRPGYYRKSILKIEQFELEYKIKCLVISNPKYLTWGHIQTMLLLNKVR
jgi:hypothetical protein